MDDTCCGSRFEPMEPSESVNYIYREAMVGGMDQRPLRRCNVQNCCPDGKCEYCFGDFCAFRTGGTYLDTGLPNMGTCMLGHASK